MRSLEQLGLASNAIGARGGAALTAALAGHPRLAVLELGAVLSARALGEPATRSATTAPSPSQT